jgi:hypothetical protein
MVDTRNFDFTNVLTPEHAGKWVALSSDRRTVIAYADDIDELAREVGNKEVVYLKARKPGVSYAF